MYILAEHIRSTHPTPKFSECPLGPFVVTKKISSLSYRLDLPDYLRSVHPVFHVSQLEPYMPSIIPNRMQTPPPPVVVDKQEEYEVTKVLDSKVNCRCKACLLLYYVRWKGYEGTPDEFSWVLATELHVMTHTIHHYTLLILLTINSLFY